MLTPEQVDRLVEYCKSAGGPIGITRNGEVVWYYLPPGTAEEPKGRDGDNA